MSAARDRAIEDLRLLRAAAAESATRHSRAIAEQEARVAALSPGDGEGDDS